MPRAKEIFPRLIFSTHATSLLFLSEWMRDVGFQVRDLWLSCACRLWCQSLIHEGVG